MALLGMEYFDEEDSNKTLKFRGFVDRNVNGGSGTNMGDITKDGYYFITGSAPQGFPQTTWNILVVMSWGAGSGVQLVLDPSGPYIRKFVGNPPTWSSWNRCNVTPVP